MIRICAETLFAPFRKKRKPAEPPPPPSAQRLFVPAAKLGPLFDFGLPDFPLLIPLHLVIYVCRTDTGQWWAAFQDASGISPKPLSDDTATDLKNALGIVDRPTLRVYSE